MLNVIDVGGDGALEVGDNALLHLLRREAVVDPEDRNDRDVDVGEDIDRHGGDGAPAEDGDENSHDDEGVGATES